ncbi:hypothetical protein C8R42DRAFT_776279 [Lentinula raphanica]|nr:hypothetical protein C8R42DRAFT_776279 [Lentinula raphanica]
MLARFSKGTAHALGVSFSRGRSLQDSMSTSSSDSDSTEEVILDIDVLLLPIQEFLAPWWQYTKTLAPVCSSLQSLLNDDVERISQLLLSLEPPDEDEECLFENIGDVSEEESSCFMNIGPKNENVARYHERPPYRQHDPLSKHHQKSPIVLLPGSHISIPTIIITFSEPQTRETSVLIPIQDCAFGSRLTVPYHTRLNHTFPPMANPAPPIHFLSDIKWDWRDGHWQAILPGVDEQMLKRMFSKPISHRRHCSRSRSRLTTHCTTGPASHS